MCRSAFVLGVVSLLSVSAAHAQTSYSGTPNATINPTEAQPGVYAYSADYTWDDEMALDGWASDAWQYTSVSQNTSYPNVLNLRTGPAGTIEYRFVVDEDLDDISQIVVSTSIRRGVALRIKGQESGDYSAIAPLAVGSTNYPASPYEIIIDKSFVNGAVPGQTEFFLRLQNEGGSNLGALANLGVEITVVPEPATLLAAMPLGLLLLRRVRPE